MEIGDMYQYHDTIPSTCIEKAEYCIVSFKVQNLYGIDLFSTWTSLHELSYLLISEISEADSAINLNIVKISKLKHNLMTIRYKCCLDLLYFWK